MISYRRITPADDAQIAAIIRNNLIKFDLAIPGTAYADPFLDHLSGFYNGKPSERAYFVAVDDAGCVLGGAGVAECDGVAGRAELQKLSVDERAKRMGIGRQLVRMAEEWAKLAGYRALYLETHTNLAIAIGMYERMGYRRLETPASVVHCVMDHFYEKEL